METGTGQCSVVAYAINYSYLFICLIVNILLKHGNRHEGKLFKIHLSFVSHTKLNRLLNDAIEVDIEIVKKISDYCKYSTSQSYITYCISGPSMSHDSSTYQLVGEVLYYNVAVS